MIEEKDLTEGLPLEPGGEAGATLPGPVEAALFGQAPRLYALLDAALMPALSTTIEDGELEALCLFYGDLAGEAAEVAPWLVSLAPDTPLLRKLLTDEGPEGGGILGHWRAQPGILIRTGLEIEALRRHLRRLMRVQDDDGRWYFMRFWEPRSFATYLTGLTDRPETVARWVYPREGGEIDLFALPFVDAGEVPRLHTFRAGKRCPVIRNHRGLFHLTREDIAAFTTLRWQRDVEGVARRLRSAFPETTGPHTPAALEAFCAETMRRMLGHRLHHLAALFTCCAWELHFGPAFETRDPTGEALRILEADAPPELRFTRLSAHMEALEAQNAFAAP